MLVTIQLDDSLVEDAKTLLQAWQEAGYASKTLPTTEADVLKNAVNLGLATLRGVWLREGTTKIAQQWREAQNAEKEITAGTDRREPGSEGGQGAVGTALPQNERDGV